VWYTRGIPHKKALLLRWRVEEADPVIVLQRTDDALNARGGGKQSTITLCRGTVRTDRGNIRGATSTTSSRRDTWTQIPG
jgi:hypothetical protein